MVNKIIITKVHIHIYVLHGTSHRHPSVHPIAHLSFVSACCWAASHCRLFPIYIGIGRRKKMVQRQSNGPHFPRISNIRFVLEMDAVRPTLDRISIANYLHFVHTLKQWTNARGCKTKMKEQNRKGFKRKNFFHSPFLSFQMCIFEFLSTLALLCRSPSHLTNIVYSFFAVAGGARVVPFRCG